MTLAKAITALPADFIFGTATSSYQIEGNRAGNCGASHWDTFAAANRTHQSEDGAIACDHYNLWAQDLDLIKACGFDAYRFSFSWPRILPETHTGVNPQGIDFYDRLIDGMLERGLSPFATLYHWDLPVRLADKGGWQNRDTPARFADYAALIIQHFGDRLQSVAPINEPWCVAWLSHYWGDHAPGLRDLAATARAMHHVQLGHGLAVQALRAAGQSNIGAVLNKEYPQPIDDSIAAQESAHLFDGIYNRWFEESLFKGSYPAEVLSVFDGLMPDDWQADMAVISSPLDWIGVNYYTRAVIAPDASEPNIGFRCERGDLDKTDMGWEVFPEGLTFFLERLARDYSADLPIYVTENGMAGADVLAAGVVDDTARVAYYAAHLAEVAGCVARGVPVKGYFTWSLLDNYEWAFGYDKRFGLVYVDFETQERVVKRSWQEWQAGLMGR